MPFNQLYIQLIQSDLCPTIGVADFIRTVKANKKSIGVVSSGSACLVQAALDKLALGPVFDIVVNGEHVNKHKPHPAPYFFAAAKLNTTTNNIIVFEDSTPGIQAAVNAGCRCIAVRHAYNTRHDFSRAIFEIRNFKDQSLLQITMTSE